MHDIVHCSNVYMAPFFCAFVNAKLLLLLRHDIYVNQYRAMFVVNCSILRDEVLKYFPKPDRRSRKRNRGKQRSQQQAAEGSNVASETEGAELYHPVRCTQCNTEVAVYDKDEIFHFFNVLTSAPGWHLIHYNPTVHVDNAFAIVPNRSVPCTCVWVYLPQLHNNAHSRYSWLLIVALCLICCGESGAGCGFHGLPCYIIYTSCSQ